MENERTIDMDSHPSTSITSFSSNTFISNSGTSPTNQTIPQKFFNTIKKSTRNNADKKRKLFETKNNSSFLYPQDIIDYSTNNCLLTPISKFKNNYLDLLITSLNKQLDNGNITLEYLNSPTLPKLSEYSSETDEEVFKKKCENKMCAVIVENTNDIYQAKFLQSLSFKSHIQWLCKKCFNAFEQGNYCYYCNIIYREFEFNQQYYDSKKWIQCDYCSGWQHVICDEKKGKFDSLEELAINPNFKYKCPLCRKESEKKRKRNEMLVKSKCLLFYAFLFIIYFY